MFYRFTSSRYAVPCFTIPDYLFRVPYSRFVVLCFVFSHSGVPYFTTTLETLFYEKLYVKNLYELQFCWFHRRTLMCVFYNKASSLLRSDTCGFLMALWFDITRTRWNTHRDMQHTQVPVDWQTHMNIYLQHLLCAHSSCFYYIHDVFSFQKLFTCKGHISLLIRCYKTRFFLWNK